MKSFVKYFYSLATILFVVGGLLLYQGNEKGALLICAGLLINSAYRFIKIDYKSILNFKVWEILKFISALFLTITVIIFAFNKDVIPYIIVAIIFDIILNFNIIPYKKK
ncbi:hypothetical protein E0494_01210 [Marinilabiliaceae bacterium JC040]|nr:hypothetical protein [Marinilabiliaceae bacterium JC040]